MFNVNNTKEQTRLNRSTFHQLYLYLPTWHPWFAELACNHHSIQTPPCSAQGARLHTKWWPLPAGSPALGLCREEQQTQHMFIVFKLYVQGVLQHLQHCACTHETMQTVPIHTQHFCCKQDEFHCPIISEVARNFSGNLRCVHQAQVSTTQSAQSHALSILHVHI